MKDNYSCCVFYDSELESYTLYISNVRTERCIVAKEFFDFDDFFDAFKLALHQKSFGSIEIDRNLVNAYNNRRTEYELPGIEVIIVSNETIHIYLPMLPVSERERWLKLLSRKTVKLSRDSFSGI